MSAALLEVAVLDPRDVPGAEEGGADRLLLATSAGRSPEPALASNVCWETDLPVHVVLRLNDTWSTTGGELTRLVGLAEDYLGAGAAGLCFGFLDAELEVDDQVCGYLAAQLPGVPWTFSRAVDDTLDLRRSWRRLRSLPGVAGLRSAGSPRGLEHGLDELLEVAGAEPELAGALVAGGGLVPEHVPWLLRAGIRRFHVGRRARPGASYDEHVDAGHVRSWRLLLDAAAVRAGRSAG